MVFLLIGLGVFLAVHLLPAFPTARAAVVARLGDGIYRALFSVISLAAIVLVVVGLKRSEFVAWYTPPAWGDDVLMLVMLPALYLFLSNTALPMPSSAPVYTPNPANWSVVLWSAGHLLANGDRANVLLFGTFLLYGLFTLRCSRRRGDRPPRDTRPPLSRELAFLLIVVVVYFGVQHGHVWISGVAIV